MGADWSEPPPDRTVGGVEPDAYRRTEQPFRRYLTLDEVAELLGIPAAEAYRRVRRGDWPGALRLQVEPRWLVPREALES